MKYFVGVEGFRMRHSVAVLADANGTLLAAHREPYPQNLHTVKPEELANRLKVLLQHLFQQAGLEAASAMPQTSLCIGMAGVTYAYDRFVVLPDIIHQHLAWQIGSLICTGDAEIVFLSHAKCCKGSLIISHAGSVAYVVGEADGELQHFRYGGWGPQIGDEGSGYWIGREIMREICLEHAEGQPESPLWKGILSWLSEPLPATPIWSEAADEWRMMLDQFEAAGVRRGVRTDPRTLIYRFAHNLAFSLKDDQCRFLVSGFVIPLMKVYREHPDCERVASIIQRAMSELAKQHGRARALSGKVELGPSDPIVYYGGVLDHNLEARAILTDELTKSLGWPVTPITRETPRTMRPALGALLFALGGSQTGRLRAPGDDVISHAEVQQAAARWRSALVND